MPMKWEIEMRDPCEDDDGDDISPPDDEDCLDFPPGVSEACFGDWLWPSPIIQ